VIISRGIFAALLLVIVALYALQALVVQPLYETSLLPVQEFRTLTLPMDFKISNPISWNIVVVSY